MLAISGQPRFLVYRLPINMNKSFEGLIRAVEMTFPEELFTHSYFVFLNKRKDLMKVLYWDTDGFAIWYKRLEKGGFTFKGDKQQLSRSEFLMLLEGVVPKRKNRRFSLD